MQPAKVKKTELMAKAVPARYKAPPALAVATKGGSKWFVFALAIAVAGLVAKRSKIATAWVGAGSA